MAMSNYVIKAHVFFVERVTKLIERVTKLRKLLPDQEYRIHPTVKLLARIERACFNIIPKNPNHSDYYLKGKLAKFRRYKKGLQRYRIIYCFSQNPPLIAYLYLNDEAHLRTEGGKNDPYEEFETLLNTGAIGSDLNDIRLRTWIQRTFTL